MDLIINFLVEDHLPNDEKEAERICRITARFWLSEDRRLYWRSFRGPYLLCLHPSKVNELLTEIHEWIYGSLVKGRSLAH